MAALFIGGFADHVQYRSPTALQIMCIRSSQKAFPVALLVGVTPAFTALEARVLFRLSDSQGAHPGTLPDNPNYRAVILHCERGFIRNWKLRLTTS